MVVAREAVLVDFARFVLEARHCGMQLLLKLNISKMFLPFTEARL